MKVQRLRSNNPFGRPVARATLFLIVTALTGVVGYKLLGPPETGWLDAAYMTVITLTTVGYGETVDLRGNAAGQVFTIFLIMGGVGSFLMFFSSLTAFIVEGRMGEAIWRRKMQKRIAALRGHVVVCGAGHTGRHVVSELHATGRPFVVLEFDEAIIEELKEFLGDTEFCYVIGDATEDAILLRANIEHAGGMVACLSNDKDNLIATVSARMINEGVRIVCRAIDPRVSDKIRRAGADSVVSPNHIGGLRMISELVRPAAVSFLDQMLRSTYEGLRVESTEVQAGSKLDGAALSVVRHNAPKELLVVALVHGDGTWDFNPSASIPLVPGVSLVYMSTPDHRKSLEADAHAS